MTQEGLILRAGIFQQVNFTFQDLPMKTRYKKVLTGLYKRRTLQIFFLRIGVNARKFFNLNGEHQRLCRLAKNDLIKLLFFRVRQRE